MTRLRLCRVMLMTLLLAAADTAMAGPSVVDDTGRRVALDAPAQRIISLAPNLTEVLYAAGAGDRIVAAVSHSDYPAAARELPRVGSYARLNIEAILAYDPDLVVAWKSGNPRRQVHRLREFRLALYISEPQRLEDIAQTLVRLGTLAGTRDPALHAADRFRQRLSRLRRRYSGRPAIDVFYQVWDDPLVTISGAHVISDVIRGCGGRNVFADLPVLAPRVSIEAVLKRNPEVIVASGTGAARPEWLDMWRRWPGLTATARDHLFYIPPDILQRHTPRILDGMARMCRLLERARSGRGGA